MSDKTQSSGFSGVPFVELHQERVLVSRDEDVSQQKLKARKAMRTARNKNILKAKIRASLSRSSNVVGRDESDINNWDLDAKDQALLDSFDSRLVEAHRGMDRILARLNVE